MQISYSRFDCFEGCKYRYKLRYLDGLKTLPSDKPDDALILGHALHTGIEQGVDAGISEYLNAYPVITDAHVNEQIKLEYWIPRVQAALPKGQHEVPVTTPDFVGFIDLLTPVTGVRGSEMPGLFDLWDFKYTGNGSRYADSPQLSLYKYFFEQTHPGMKIRSLTFVIIPKVNIRQKGSETLTDFRKRIEDELSKKELTFMQVDYDPEKVIGFFNGTKHLLECADYDKHPGFLCNWCEYQDFCQKGVDYMILPKNERRVQGDVTKKVIWMYGAPFSGKTTFANTFPDPLMLNTDGNIKYVDAPFIPIRDEVTVDGRLTKRTLAWDVFKSVIDELEKKQNSFKTIIVDLVEDCYEACRLYMYDQMGITHESDDAFRAWDKVRTEFLSTMRRFVNLDYENIILISHEDTTKDITKKSGDRLTSIKPNIQDKVANKLAGMVDIVARVIADGDERILSFKTNEVIFGGGRLNTKTTEIPLDYHAFCRVYQEAAPTTPKKAAEAPKPDVNRVMGDDEEALAETVKKAEDAEMSGTEPVEPNTGEAVSPGNVPVLRQRRKRNE